MTHWIRGRLSRSLRPIEEERGQGLAEYALIITLVAIGCVAGLTALGLAIAGSPGFVSLPGSL